MINLELAHPLLKVILLFRHFGFGVAWLVNENVLALLNQKKLLHTITSVFRKNRIKGGCCFGHHK